MCIDIIIVYKSVCANPLGIKRKEKNDTTPTPIHPPPTLLEKNVFTVQVDREEIMLTISS